MSTTSPTRVDVPQYLLPRQAAAPAGPVDARMMYVMHHAFRRDLVMFEQAARVTPVDDREAWAALAERWGVFGAQLHHHHAGEDAGLWPLLEQHADAEERAVLEAMEAEHAVIDPLLAEVGQGFAAAVATDDQGVADRLAESVAAARECLEGHLRHEESEAMAMVQKHLTTESWEAMAREHFGRGQSLAQLRETLPWATHELPAPALAGLLEQAGLPFRVLLRLTRGRFARREAVATRHLRATSGGNPVDRPAGRA